MNRELPRYVLDSSVGVKWFKPEIGQVPALALLERASRGQIELIAPVHFAHEVLSVVRRHYAASDVIPAWARMAAAGVQWVPLTDEVIAEASRQCDLLGCSFYDSLAPACASLLEATLASADARAHGGYPGVELLSEQT